MYEDMTDMTDDQIDALLEKQWYGHLACYGEGELYLVPITYAYDAGNIISYTHEGKKVSMMRDRPEVCVQVESVKSPADWRSVICWGQFEEVTDSREKQQAAMKIAEKFAQAQSEGKPIYSPLLDDIAKYEGQEEELPVMYRVRVTKKTGKRQKAG